MKSLAQSHTALKELNPSSLTATSALNHPSWGSPEPAGNPKEGVKGSIPKSSFHNVWERGYFWETRVSHTVRALEMFLFKRTISRYREIVGVLYVLGGPALGGCGKGTSHPTSRRCSHVSEMLPGGPALGSEGHVLHPRCLFALLEPLAMAPDSSSLVWPGHRISHPQEMPPSGPGKDPSISTPGECVWCCAVGVGKVECFLLSRSERDLGTTWGPPPSHLLAGEMPSPVPLPCLPPSPSCAGA